MRGGRCRNDSFFGEDRECCIQPHCSDVTTLIELDAGEANIRQNKLNWQ